MMFPLLLVTLTLVTVLGINGVVLYQQESNAPLINVAGRQRMLSQRMTKEALLLAIETDEVRRSAHRASLAGTTDLFDRSLGVLLEGGELEIAGQPVLFEAIDDAGALEKLEAGRSLWVGLTPAIEALLDPALVAGSDAEREALEALQAENLALLKLMNEATVKLQKRATAGIHLLEYMDIAAISVGLVIFGFSFWYTRVSLIRPIQRIRNEVIRISEGDGDLTKRIAVTSKDEVGELSQSFNVLIDKIEHLVEAIEQAAGDTYTTSSQLVAQTYSVVENLKQQGSQTSQIAAAAEEMSASGHEVADKSATAQQAASQAGSEAEKGRAVVSETINDMTQIAETVGRSSESVERLGELGTQIGEVITVINEIADQTNLLALNAAIEAARAGEHGRGFAVVADEVRKLADRTTKATEEIGGSIESIRQGTGLAVTEMNQGKQLVQQGVGRASNADESLASILEANQEVDELVAGIAQASSEQRVASDSVSQSITSISTVLTESITAAETTAEGIAAVAEKTSELKTLIEKFNLRTGGTVKAEAV